MGRMIDGLQELHADDDTLLQHGMAMFEALARSFSATESATGRAAAGAPITGQGDDEVPMRSSNQRTTNDGRTSMKRLAVVCAVLSLTSFASLARAQEMPAAYKQVLDTLGKTGDFKDNVLKVNIPRNDLSITVANVKTPTPFGFGGWVAMTKGTGGMDVMMGDLVLTQDEVNPVMSALLDNGLEVTALHNHFFWDEPRMFYMHVHGHGTWRTWRARSNRRSI